MEKRLFGRTGLPISVFTLGTMRFLHGWDEPHDSLPDDSLQNAHEVISTALSAGINLIETARGYGKSERLIGQVLPRIPQARNVFRLMSKAPPLESPRAMRQAVEESLTFLGVSRLDLFALHGLNNPERCHLALRRGGSLEVLEKLRAEGLIGAIGFSSHAPLPLLLQTIASNRFDFVNLHYYYFRPGNRAAVDLANALNMGLFIISPNDKGGSLYDAPQELVRRTAPLHPVHFNERWLLSQPTVHTLSIGLSEAGHWDIHRQSLETSPYWGETERDIHLRLQQAMRSPLDRCPTCRQCLPCPEAIEIPEMLRLFTLATSLGMDFHTRYRYEMMSPGDNWMPGNRAEACTRCNDCLPRCPQQLDIPAWMQQFAKQFPRSNPP
ncbi:MAG: aldo/keto reductase [Magnetococcales bacterium]|nr:aldo/keto reductase [Magnetococcales bacterium]